MPTHLEVKAKPPKTVFWLREYLVLFFFYCTTNFTVENELHTL
jgi:hypothetical protein